MPCGDISEKLNMILGPDNRVVSYALVKKTCQAPVGGTALVLDQVRGLSAQEILETPADQLLEPWLSGTEDEQFGALKHLSALRETLTQIQGEPSDHCALARVWVDPLQDHIHIESHLMVDLSPSQVSPCGSCGGGCDRHCATR